MRFQDNYTDWLADAFKNGVPDGVVAFTFNLYEQPKHEAPFGVELVGAGSFDPDGRDWAGDEVWEPAQGRNYDIPIVVSGKTWEKCLESMKRLLGRVMSDETPVALRLRSTKGVGVGFVDGEMFVLWAG
ncbi:MAG: hypothetical protein ABI668_04255 [Sphingorhabdus sp.]